jgi:hypothetical protein
VKQEATTAGFADPRARGGGLIGRPQGPWRAGPGCCTAGEAVPRPDSGASPSLARARGRDDPDRRAPSVSKRKKGREEEASGGLAGPGKEASRLGQLGHAVGRESNKVISMLVMSSSFSPS